VSSGPEALYALASEYLVACAAGLALTPGGEPDYQAIWPGPPSFDCASSSLLVYVGAANVADTYPLQPPLQPMQRISTTGQVDLIALTAVVLRCVPGIEDDGQNLLLPSTDKISAAAAICYADLWGVWNYLKNQFRAGLLFASQSNRREFQFDPAIPVQSQGGVAGWSIPIRIQLGGYS